MTKNELIAIKRLIAKKENWCTKAYAKDSKDQAVSYCSPQAVKFCLLGSFWKATEYEATEELWSLFRVYATRNDIAYVSLSQFNDRSGFRAVHRFLNWAIARAE